MVTCSTEIDDSYTCSHTDSPRVTQEVAGKLIGHQASSFQLSISMSFLHVCRCHFQKQKKMARHIIVVSRGTSVCIWCKSTENWTKRISQIGAYGFHSTNTPRIGNQGSWGDLDDTSWAQAPLLLSSCFSLKGEALVLLLLTSPGATCDVTSASQAGGPL